jgi:hypothetical protein
MVAAGEAQFGRVVETRTGLVDALFAGEHYAREDQGLRLGPAFGEALVDDELVGPSFGQPGLGQARAVRRD